MTPRDTLEIEAAIGRLALAWGRTLKPMMDHEAENTAWKAFADATRAAVRAEGKE